MAKKIRIGIVGFGNLGRGVKRALERNPDMELTCIFTRRPEQVKKEVEDVRVLPIDGCLLVDVAILCGGSKVDIPLHGPAFIRWSNTVDSFDTHAEILNYFQKMDFLAKKFDRVAIISAGWDPGIFSLERVLGEAFLPVSKQYTFWGKGVSQGHSDAARKVKGVLDARQYTLPIKEAIEQVRRGLTPDFAKGEMHERVVYVVPEEGADLKRIEEEIKTMPNYYADYRAKVIFISEQEMERDHSAFPHKGLVLTSGETGNDNRQILEYKCQLTSNPEFTASVLVACARATCRMRERLYKGAFTLLDFPLGLLSPDSGNDLKRRMI